MSKAYSMIFVLFLLFCACTDEDKSTTDTQGETDQVLDTQSPDADGEDEQETRDQVEDLAEYIGKDCDSMYVDSCPSPLVCVNTHSTHNSATVCDLTDYLGECQLLPTSCEDEPIEPVCDCYNNSFDNACELRKTGYLNTIVECE